MKKGMRGLLIVVLATAAVMFPLIIGGVLLGYYVGGQLGFSGSILAIAFSTVGFIAGMAVIFRVIRSVVSWVDRPTS